METPLLHQPGEGERGPQEGMEEWEGDCPPVKGWGGAWPVFAVETRKLWRIAAPIVFNSLTLYGINSVTQIFVGHIGSLELSAVAIGLSVIGNFVTGFMTGMASALGTLCGQAFGVGQVRMLGIYLQRSWIILTVSAVILSPIYVFATQILKLIGQEDDIADLAGRFTLLILPQIFSSAVNFPVQSFLQAQSKVMVMAGIAIVALLVHIAILWVFIFGLGWGLYGAAIAFDLTCCLNAAAQVVYVVGWCKDAWTGLSLAAFNDLWAFVRLSLSSALMMCMGSWYMMVLVVLVGYLSDAEIAVGSVSICMNINGWEAVFFIGMNMAISVRVSNELGSGHPRAAKYSVLVVVLQSLAISIVCVVVILASRNYFAVIFTNDTEIQQAVAKIAYLLAVTMVLNSVQQVITGVAVGGGWQALVAYINLGCYYIFGLPLGLVLGYVVHWGVEGIWAGMLCGIAAQTIMLLVAIWRTNWNSEAAQASARVRLWGGQGNGRVLKPEV
ncbi:hypothetical protein Taro_038575 [Colocasia esculenta]|uniref:Protein DETOXIFICATION n=1 Tax=Colocasia esculenta TaxID=4460 RepID=A0A843WJM4_COLES|nr:hypothetical protein [Colocasia esculenta]